MQKETQRKLTLGYLMKTHKVELKGKYYGFACKSPECQRNTGTIDTHNSGKYYFKLNAISCWQPDCRYSKPYISKDGNSRKTHPAWTYISTLEGLANTGDTEGLLTSGNYQEVEGYLPASAKQLASKQVTEQLYFPPEAIPINRATGVMGNAAIEYVKNGRRNGFDPDWLWEKFKVCYAPRGAYMGYILIPSKDRYGNFQYFQARDFIGRGPKDRWKNPSASDNVIGKSQVVFNEADLFKGGRVFIVEGAFCAFEMARLENVSHVFGSNPSDYQLSVLASSNATIYQVLDNDALAKSKEMARKLTKAGKRPYVVELPGRDDCNDLGVKRVLEIAAYAPLYDERENFNKKPWKIKRF